ncbi:MAG: carboxypeptidase regulatory-like domain-containing protein [Planctomycetia bacterium]|nr:carboxypeptidase regulatory-like domain-containing protein [Planctomycetia bacterium]
MIGHFTHATRRAILGLVLAAPPALCRHAAADEPLSNGTLSGQIVNAERAAVADAHVWVKTFDDKVLAEATSDAAGRFRLGPVEPLYRHRFDLFVDAGGYACQYVTSDTWSVLPGKDFDMGAIQLDRGRVFKGQVLDVDGQPVAGASVECCTAHHVLGHTIDFIGPPQIVTTDAEGHFRSRPMPVGRFSVEVAAPNRQKAYRRRLAPSGGEETLEPIRLEKDVPIPGLLTDEAGHPIVDAAVSAGGVAETKSDAVGRFTLAGFGPNPSFQLQIQKEGYVFINWGVTIKEDGIRWQEVSNDDPPNGPFPDLHVRMKRTAWIDGQAVDAETGVPVRIERVVLCFFERKPNGEVVLSGCRDARFEQPETGRFRVSYSYPDEYHLTVSATGYHDGEAFTPKVTELRTIDGMLVKLKKKRPGTPPVVASQRITGRVMRGGGQPVRSGWVGLWALRRTPDSVNAHIMRGRTVEGGPVAYASTPVRDGDYVLDVPFQDENWYVVVEEPGHALTQVGPIPIGVNETKQVNVACVAGGSLRGRVSDVPPEWRGHVWAVAFTKTGIRMQTRARPDGEFSFTNVPPGEYGLKAGHDAHTDSEVPQDPDIPKEAWERRADPWQRATVVRVESGSESAGVELSLPK